MHPALPDLASVLHPKIFSRTPARTSSSTPEENQNEEDPKKTLCPEEEKNARRSRPLLYRRFYHTFTPAMTIPNSNRTFAMEDSFFIYASTDFWNVFMQCNLYRIIYSLIKYSESYRR